MRIGLWQGLSPAGGTSAAFAAVERALRHSDADMLVMPELFLSGYNSDPGEGMTADALQARVAPLCRATGTALTIGFAETGGWNAALAIGKDGERLCHYRKVQLYGAREKRLFQPGDHIPTFYFEGRKAALLICYDIEFAPHVAALAAAGVELILVPTANMRPFVHVPRVTVPAMAANHAVTIAYANYCGVEGDLHYCGESLVAGADGTVLASAGATEVLLAVSIAAVDPARLSTQGIDFRPVPVR